MRESGHNIELASFQALSQIVKYVQLLQTIVGNIIAPEWTSSYERMIIEHTQTRMCIHLSTSHFRPRFSSTIQA